MLDLKNKIDDVVERTGIDKIRNALERVIERVQKNVAEEKPKTIADVFLEELGFYRKLRGNLVGKAIDIGNLSRSVKRSECYKKLNERLK